MFLHEIQVNACMITKLTTCLPEIYSDVKLSLKVSTNSIVANLKQKKRKNGKDILLFKLPSFKFNFFFVSIE